MNEPDKLNASVLCFAVFMFQRLIKNTYREHWDEKSLHFLISKLNQNLQDLMKGDDSKRMFTDCVDIANYAMMIAENLQRDEENS